MNWLKSSRLTFKVFSGSVVAWSVFSTLCFVPVYAQVIPENNGTGTLVDANDNLFEISGGSFSADGVNLFHSFQEFGLSSGDVANFLSNPNVVNVLGRVAGGEASVIDGLLQVSGGHSNLFLMNPAGVVFGPNSQLDISASFVATTADGIQFGDGWLSATGENNYAELLGSPTGFGFSLADSGAIINAGELAVGDGQSLMLLGGSVVSTGALSARQGEVVVSAVPGERYVRLSVPGSVLSLEVLPLAGDGANDWVIPVASLSELLTVGTVDVGVMASGDGASGESASGESAISLTASGVRVPDAPGTVVVAGTVDVGGETGGDVGVLGERVALVEADVSAEGESGGGQVFIGGDYRGQGRLPTASRTYVDENSVISASALARGDGGQVIVWGNDVTGFYGAINARGGLTLGDGGFVEVSSPETLLFDGVVDVSAWAGSAGTLLLDPRNIRIAVGPSNPSGVDSSLPTILEDDFQNADITIQASVLQQQVGNILLEASNNIEIDNGVSLSFTNDIGSQIEFKADADANGIGDFLMDSSETLTIEERNLTISGDNIVVGTIVAADDSSSARNEVVVDINGTGSISIAGISEVRDVRISGGEAVSVGDILSVGNGYGDGSVVAIAGDSMTIGAIDTSADNSFGANVITGGNVTLTAGNALTTGPIDTSADSGFGGNVTLTADGDVQTDYINATGEGAGGDVSITSRRGLVRFIDSFEEGGEGTPFRSLSTASAGDDDGGSIFIEHQGGFLDDPFQVETLSDLQNGNGSVSGISSGPDSTLVAGDYPDDFQLGNIRLETNTALEEPFPPVIDDPEDGPDGPDVVFPSPGGGGGTTFDPSPKTPNIPEIDIDAGESYRGRLDLPIDQSKEITLASIYESLNLIEEKTGVTPAVIYASFVPLEVAAGEIITRRSDEAKDSDQLELVMVSAKGEPVRRRVFNTNRADVLRIAKTFSDSIAGRRRDYQPMAEQLYSWLISPLDQVLQERGVDNLVFIMDEGLRSIPLAAMHSGESFVVEDYSVGLMPSLSLTDLNYSDIRDLDLLARGSEVFPTAPELGDLPGARTEIEILRSLWPGNFDVEANFTIENLIQSRQAKDYRIVHLATHADFVSGNIDQSFIQMWDSRLQMSDLRNMGWGNDPPLELLVLSACETALGDPDAELGFAGLAAKAGVKSAFASLWPVSDLGTLPLVSEFYGQLRDVPVKAEALRQAQLAMLRNEIGFEGGQLKLSKRLFPLPPEIAGRGDLSHPYYWAGFTIVGNPW